jgi:Leu/Phe-tRNA-protein transferase
MLRRQGAPLIDCQQETAHLGSFGARGIARVTFAGHLSELIHSTEPVAGWRAGAIEASDIELR